MEDNNEEKNAVAVKSNTAVAEKTNWARLHGSWSSRIEGMLPEKSMIDQFMYCAEGQYGKNREAFEKCTPVSLLNCLLTCAKYGILPDGKNAYLIPYGNECTLQFDYKGYVHVVIRDGVAKRVYCEVICENDQFEYRNGMVTNHVISMPRGNMIGAYCDITLCNGEHQYEIMDIDEIENIKKCSKSASSPQSPWNRFYKEMAKKSVFRRAIKWLKLSPDVIDAIKSDDEDFDFSTQRETKRNAATLFTNSAPAIENNKQESITVQAEIVEKEKVKASESAKSNLPF